MQEYTFMRAVIESDPKASEEEHKASFWAAIQKAPRRERDVVLRSLANAYFGQRRTTVIRSLGIVTDRDLQRQTKAERQRKFDETTARDAALVRGVIEQRARALAAEMVAQR